MRRIATMMFLSLISISAWASEQEPDIFEGRGVPVDLEIRGKSPLEHFFYRSSYKSPFELFSTGNYRRHVASWSIVNGDLFLLKVRATPVDRSLSAYNADLGEFDFSEMYNLQRTENGIRASWFTGAILLAVDPHKIESEGGRYHIGHRSYEIVWFSGGKLTKSVVLTPDDYRKGAREVYSDKPLAELSELGVTIDEYYEAQIYGTKPLSAEDSATLAVELSPLPAEDSSTLATSEIHEIPYLRSRAVDRRHEPKRFYEVENLVGKPQYVSRVSGVSCRRTEKISTDRFTQKIYFDRQGRVVEFNWIPPSSSRKKEFLYPQSGLRNTVYRSHGDRDERFSRDASGNVITNQKIYANSDGTFTRDTVAKYQGKPETEIFDKKGYLVGQLVGDNESRRRTEIAYEFDNTGKIKQKNVVHKSLSRIQTEFHEHNDRGDLVSVKYHAKSSSHVDEYSISTNLYDYDEQGNWIVKKVCSDTDGISDDDRCRCFARGIDYYD